MKTRRLKIEACGNHFRGEIKPRLRLCGYWLAQAGFLPGSHVRIIQSKPGELTLQLLEDQVTALMLNESAASVPEQPF